MKKVSKIQTKRRLRTLAGVLFLSSVIPSYAVFPFALSTDGSGAFTNGGWSGSGAVQPNINPGTYAGTTISRIMVENFSAGTLTVNQLGGNLFDLPNPRLKDVPFGVSHTITLTGGTADLRMANSNAFDNGASQWNSTGLTDFQGVTAITFKTIFESPIATRAAQDLGTARFGLGAGLALITAGTGQNLSSFTVGLTYDGIFSDSTPPAAGLPFDRALPGYTAGVPGTAAINAQAGFGSPAPGSTSFTSTAFTGLDQFLLVRAYDNDGTSGFQSSDGPTVYITEMTWTITKDDNSAFSPNTLFVVSMDGQQYGTTLIPEPSAALLGLGGMLLFASRRLRA